MHMNGHQSSALDNCVIHGAGHQIVCEHFEQPVWPVHPTDDCPLQYFPNVNDCNLQHVCTLNFFTTCHTTEETIIIVVGWAVAITYEFCTLQTMHFLWHVKTFYSYSCLLWCWCVNPILEAVVFGISFFLFCFEQSEEYLFQTPMRSYLFVAFPEVTSTPELAFYVCLWLHCSTQHPLPLSQQGNIHDSHFFNC